MHRQQLLSSLNTFYDGDERNKMLFKDYTTT